MAAMASAGTAGNPVSDLMYDWLTVLQSKAEGLNAYDKYIRDAEKEDSPDCVQLFRRLKERDAEMVREVKDHVAQMMAKQP
jgi:hypothetical protein